MRRKGKLRNLWVTRFVRRRRWTARAFVRTLSALLSLWLFLTSPTSVQAQSTPVPGSVSSAAQAESPPGYRSFITAAVAEFAAGNVAESRALFARAHALHPNARTHRGMGLADFQLRNYTACVKQLRAALASEVKPLDATLRAETQALLARARGFVARVVVETRPAATRVLLDGTPVRGDRGRPFFAPLGKHVVQVEAPKHRPTRRALQVFGGENLRLTLPLTPLPTDSAVTRAEDESWYTSPWLWTAALALAAGAITATVVIAGNSDPGETTRGGNTGIVIAGPSSR